MWNKLIEPIFGYIALLIVLGAVLVTLYILVIATFLIRKIIYPEMEAPKVSWKVHKWFWKGVAGVFMAGVILFAATLIPALLALYALYLFFKHAFPLLVKKTIPKS